GIETRHLGRAHGGDRPAAVGRAVDDEIVDDDELLVGRAVHVEFDAVDAHRQGCGEGGQCVLGRNTARATVGKNGWAVAHSIPSLFVISTTSRPSMSSIGLPTAQRRASSLMAPVVTRYA